MSCAYWILGLGDPDDLPENRFPDNQESRIDPDTFENYRDTPPISIAMLLQKYALLLAESSIYATNLYHDAPTRYFCRSIRVRGRWATPKIGPEIVINLSRAHAQGSVLSKGAFLPPSVKKTLDTLKFLRLWDTLWEQFCLSDQSALIGALHLPEGILFRTCAKSSSAQPKTHLYENEMV